MYAEVIWPSGRSQPTLFVPQTAVAVTTEKMFVIRVKNGIAEWVDVTRGVAVENLVEVFGDLSPGDQVVVRGTDELRNGTPVNAKGQ